MYGYVLFTREVPNMNLYDGVYSYGFVSLVSYFVFKQQIRLFRLDFLVHFYLCYFYWSMWNFGLVILMCCGLIIVWKIIFGSWSEFLRNNYVIYMYCLLVKIQYAFIINNNWLKKDNLFFIFWNIPAGVEIHIFIPGHIYVSCLFPIVSLVPNGTILAYNPLISYKYVNFKSLLSEIHLINRRITFCYIGDGKKKTLFLDTSLMQCILRRRLFLKRH